MARISPLDYDEAPPATQGADDDHETHVGGRHGGLPRVG